MANKDIYEANKVMQILGQQHTIDNIGADFCAVYDAHIAATDVRDNSLSNIALDFYTLGIITGKRLERAAKNHKEYVPLTVGGVNNGSSKEKRF